MQRFIAIGVMTIALAGGTLLGNGKDQLDVTARPVVSTRITSVDAQAGNNTLHVAIQARCAVGWDNSVYAQHVIVRQDAAAITNIVSANFTGAEVGWQCDGLEHSIELDFVADLPWRAGRVLATFEVTVSDGTNTGADFAHKFAHIR